MAALLSAVQFTALVCQQPFRVVVDGFLAQGWTAFDKLGPITALQLAGHDVQFTTVRTGPVKTIGALAWQAMLDGDTCMLRSACRQIKWRAAGIGIEWKPGNGQAPTLMLLSPQAIEPWAGSYKARLTSPVEPDL